MILYAKMNMNNTSSAVCFCPKMSLLHTNESHVDCCCVGAFGSLFGCVVLCLLLLWFLIVNGPKKRSITILPRPKQFSGKYDKVFPHSKGEINLHSEFNLSLATKCVSNPYH